MSKGYALLLSALLMTVRGREPSPDMFRTLELDAFIDQAKAALDIIEIMGFFAQNGNPAFADMEKAELKNLFSLNHSISVI